ncbi:MAG: acyl carrier protein [Anaerolineae bacterium]|nr:acyl carrier protein [Anaerolineae bacterium]
MTEQEIRTKLVEIFEEEAKLDRDELLQGQPLANLIDSLTLLEIVCQIEDTFELEIEDEQIPELKTFADVVEGITRLKGPDVQSN